MTSPLREYAKKRNFRRTPEPGAKTPRRPARAKALSYVIQEHHASRLHYDFRLELDGVLKSWAVPKGPSLDPKDKRLAVEVEDHPLKYGSFEGTIPEGQYGAGEVYLWDRGTWEPDGEPHQGLRKGHLEFELKGKRLRGKWLLVRTRLDAEKGKPNWLLIKRTDDRDGDGRGKVAKAAAIRSRRAPAARAKLPFVPPSLPRLVERPPEGAGWVHEIKFDGYRIQSRMSGGELALLTRTGLDWAAKYPDIAEALRGIAADGTVIDGEIVALDDEGRSDFQALQVAMSGEDGRGLIYYAFDLPWYEGEDLRDRPLRERKAKLEKLLKPFGADGVVRYSGHYTGSGAKFLGEACRSGLEGIVSKQLDGAYRSGRSDEWRKAKCGRRQEFVVGGFVEGQGSRAALGAILLGVYDGDKLRYAGRCGTGFNARTLADLRARFAKLETGSSPFAPAASPAAEPRGRGIHWLKPALVAEAKFANWTRDGLLRAPVFLGLREDKPAAGVAREKTERKTGGREKSARRARSSEAPRAAALTHPEKVIYPAEKLTKQDVADYFAAAAKWILPHLANRPLSLKRCPDGAAQACFFQKHPSPTGSLHGVLIEEKSAARTYVTLDSAEGLADLAQLSALELHAWNSREPDIEHPDQIVMDLDPGEGVTWKQVLAAAFRLREILAALKLKSFVKVTGGKGIHIHVPFRAEYTWEEAKDFSKFLAEAMAELEPDRYVSTVSKRARGGKIFIDYLRNGRGATAVAPYSLRARPTSSVAMPVTWEELKKLKGADAFTLPKAIRHLEKRRADPWRGILRTRQRLPLDSAK